MTRFLDIIDPPEEIQGEENPFFRLYQSNIYISFILSSIFFFNFAEEWLLKIYLVSPCLPWFLYRLGNPVPRDHPSDPADRAGLSSMPHRSHPWNPIMQHCKVRSNQVLQIFKFSFFFFENSFLLRRSVNR